MDEEKESNDVDETDPVIDLLLDMRDKLDDIGTRVYGEEQFDIEEAKQDGESDISSGNGGEQGNETEEGAPPQSTDETVSADTTVSGTEPERNREPEPEPEPRQPDHRPHSPHWYFRPRFGTRHG